jgi:hypothetical protein
MRRGQCDGGGDVVDSPRMWATHSGAKRIYSGSHAVEHPLRGLLGHTGAQCE